MAIGTARAASKRILKYAGEVSLPNIMFSLNFYGKLKRIGEVDHLFIAKEQNKITFYISLKPCLIYENTYFKYVLWNKLNRNLYTTICI